MPRASVRVYSYPLRRGSSLEYDVDGLRGVGRSQADNQVAVWAGHNCYVSLAQRWRPGGTARPGPHGRRACTYVCVCAGFLKLYRLMIVGSTHLHDLTHTCSLALSLAPSDHQSGGMVSPHHV